MNDKKHWFCFSFIDSGNKYASTYTGYRSREVTLSMIKEEKAHAGVSEAAVLLSVSYLGYMSKNRVME